MIRSSLITICCALLLLSCAPKSWHVNSLNTEFSAISDTLPQDSAIAQAISPYKIALDSVMEVVIGISEKELTKGGMEHTLGNFISDVLRTKAIEVYQAEVDLAAVTSGGLRTQIKQGALTVGDIYELMPFENELLLLQISSQQVRQLFEYGFQRKNLSVANAKVVYDKYGHIQSLTIGGEAFREDANYNLAISDYLATGGDGIDFLKHSDVALSKQYKVRDAIIDYIADLHQDGIPVNAFIENRVSILP